MAQEEKGWSLEVLNKSIKALDAKGRLNSQEIMQYVVTPYVASLGYNIFDIDIVDTNVDSATTVINALKNVDIVISLNELYPQEENAKIFVYLDTYTYRLAMYMKALGDWELLLEANIKNAEESKDYNKIREYIFSESLRQLYNAKQERLFTEGVLNRKLANREFDNAFVRAVIKAELEKPSNTFMQVIAQGLNKKFSTTNSQELSKLLSPLQKVGLTDLFGDVIDDMKDLSEYDSHEKKYGSTHANVDTSERFINDVDTSEIMVDIQEEEYDTLSEKPVEGAYLSEDDLVNPDKLNLKPDTKEQDANSLESVLSIDLDEEDDSDDDGDSLSAMFKLGDI